MNTMETLNKVSAQSEQQNEPITLLPISDELSLGKVQKAYSSPPIWYDIRGFFILKTAYRSTLWNQISLFSKNMGDRHLEGAIGTGSLFDLILKWKKITFQKVGSIDAFDYAPKMLDGAHYQFRKIKNIKLILADVSSLPYEDEYFNTINVANAIHCFPDVKSGFLELFRVLKTGGTFAGNVLLEPAGNSFLDGLSRRINVWGTRKGILNRPYRKEEITHMLAMVGFKIQYEQIIGNCYNFKVTK